ncbi:TetR/AcrR family transcriptional regulator [Acinetobacter baumannii]
MKKSSTKKEMILSTAIQLFTKESYITVGVDRIIDESQVAKATFYKHFSSKENLVIACLQRLKDEIRVSVEDRIFNLSTP